MEIGKTREVYFGEYCPECKYQELPEEKDPCDECLASPTNEFSHKPINFKPKEDKDT